MRPPRRISVALSLVALLLPGLAAAEFAGLDANGSGDCDSTDMMQQATAGDVGTSKSIGVFFRDTPNPYYGVGCVFCVSDKTKLGNISFTYSTPAGWSTVPIDDSGDGVFSITLTPWVEQQYPNYRCFLIQATDFTFTAPLDTLQHTLGTLQYEVAQEGCIQWLFDGANTGVLTTGFSSVFFDGPGETCDTVPCPAAGEPLAIDQVTPSCPVADATKDVPYPAGVIFTATGGTPPYTWSATGLPTGMTIGASTGELGGTPTVGGTANFTAKVDDSAAGHAERACEVFVQVYAVDVVLASADTAFAAEGDTVLHQFQVHNTGNVTAQFGLSFGSTGGFPVTLVFGSPNPIIPAGGYSDAHLQHIIPDLPCPAPELVTWDKAFLHAQYPAAKTPVPLAQDADTAAVGVTFSRGVNVVLLANSICGTPGASHDVTFHVTNIGVCSDTFDLEASVDEPGWTASVVGSPFVVLAPEGSVNIDVQVGVPGDALCTDEATVTFTAVGRRGSYADFDTALECVNAVLDGTLSNETNQLGAPGDTLTYCFTITNTGNCALHYELTFENHLWPIDYPGTTFDVDPGQTADFCVDHLIPVDAQNGDTDNLCAILWTEEQPPVKEANQGLVAVDTSCVVSTAGVPCESSVDVVHTGTTACGDPGATVQDTFTVHNTGACADIFDLAASIDLAGWAASIVGSPTIGLNPDQTLPVYVNVQIPAGALCTDLAQVRLGATGQTFGATDFATGPICVNPVPDGTLSDESDQFGAPGDTALYHFTITNTGNCPTTFVVGSASLWAHTADPAAEPLDPGDTAIVAIGHIIPSEAGNGDNDELCAYLQILPALAKESLNGYLDSSCVVTTAIVACDAGVDVTGGGPVGGAPGATIGVPFTVENTGSVPDRYILAASNNLGWPTDIPGPDTTAVLDVGGSVPVLVSVTVPAGTACDLTSLTDLTAYSFCNPTVWDSAVIQVYALPACAVTVEALTSDTTGVPSQAMDYLFRVTNTGNCEAGFVIEVSQSVDWDTSFGATNPVIPAGGHVDFPFHLVIPPTAQPGDEHKVIVCAFCEGDGQGPLVCDSTITRVPTGCEADQPILSLGGYQTVSYGGPTGLWTVQVALKNNGPGKAEAINAEMHEDLAWLLIPDATCAYPDLAPGASSFGIDSYTFDLQNYPGGSFNVWFDVTYTDSCGTPYQIRLDPTFLDPSQNGLPSPTSRFALHQNIPNPFNPETSISFELAAGGYTELVIYNAAGQTVKSLWRGALPAGLHTFLWTGESERGTSAPSGTYFYSLRSEGETETRRMVLVR